MLWSKFLWEQHLTWNSICGIVCLLYLRGERSWFFLVSLSGKPTWAWRGEAVVQCFILSFNFYEDCFLKRWTSWKPWHSGLCWKLISRDQGQILGLIQNIQWARWHPYVLLSEMNVTHLSVATVSQCLSVTPGFQAHVTSSLLLLPSNKSLFVSAFVMVAMCVCCV